MFWLRNCAFININIWNESRITGKISSYFSCSISQIISNVHLPSICILCNFLTQWIASKSSHRSVILSCPTSSFRNVSFFRIRPKWSSSLLKLFVLCCCCIVILLISCFIEVFSSASSPSAWLFESSCLSSLSSSRRSFAFSSRKE